MRSTATAAIPIPITVAIFTVNPLTAALSLVVRQMMGRLTAALAKDEEGIVLTAVAGYFALHDNRVAAAAVVLALLTRPPKTPVANMP